jgi:RHS repeat-associated protein
VIAEYDGNNNLLRKYIYGPGIDQPVSMIEVADANAVYYYHFDALGSVVALSNASGNTVQTYQYSVYGEVAVQDPNHTNPYMFTGRSFDVEIGLYYFRARYYNPYMGRFLQADPVGYEADMNLYRYCMNNPVNMRDPFGQDPCDPCGCTSDCNRPNDSNGPNVQSTQDNRKGKKYWEAAGYQSLSACIGDKLVLCGSLWTAVGEGVLSTAGLLCKIKLITTFASVVGWAFAVYCAGEATGAYCKCTAPAENFPELREISSSLQSGTSPPFRNLYTSDF